MTGYTKAIRKIFDSNKPAGTDIVAVGSAALKNGFKLFLFNGSIYYIVTGDSFAYHDTGLTVEDILF